MEEKSDVYEGIGILVYKRQKHMHHQQKRTRENKPENDKVAVRIQIEER